MISFECCNTQLCLWQGPTAAFVPAQQILMIAILNFGALRHDYKATMKLNTKLQLQDSIKVDRSSTVTVKWPTCKTFWIACGTQITVIVTHLLSQIKSIIHFLFYSVIEDGDTEEDKEARALLNKFLGASVLMSGMESMVPREITTIVGKPSSQKQVSFFVLLFVKWICVLKNQWPTRTSVALPRIYLRKTLWRLNWIKRSGSDWSQPPTEMY